MNHLRPDRAGSTFLPDFCGLRMVFALVLISQLLALLLALASPHGEQDFMSGYGLKSLFILWVSLSGAAILCLFRRALAKLNDIWAGVAGFAVIQGVTFAVCWLALDYLPDQGLTVMLEGPVQRAGFYWRAAGISGIVTAVLLRYLYIQWQWRMQVRAEAEVRLVLLQARMRPHFLFNSLNTIASLTRVDPPLAEELVQDLAELLRASMTVGAASRIPVAAEIALVKQYLNIERQRLGDRLRVEWRVDELPADALVPPLSLQPLIENAVYHGVEPAAGGGFIIVSGGLQKRDVIIEVTNSLPPATAKPRAGNRIAMENLAARLKSGFDGAGQMLVAKTGEEYGVRLIFPYQRERG